MSTTPDSPVPPSSGATPPPAGAEAPKPAAPKPAFKVTRSPFAPKLQGGTGGPAAPAPISIAGTAGLSSVPTPSSGPTPTAARAPRAAPKAAVVATQAKPSVFGVAIDIAAAAVAVAFAILFALSYFAA
jgi:hypothetical protein